MSEERTRAFLKPQFRDGERPSGEDFADLIDSFVNKKTDDVSFDADGNMVVGRGVRLGDSAGTAAGGLRFHSNQLQLFTGGAWVNVSGGGGGDFQPAPTGLPQAPVVRDSGVGIGNFAAAPQFKLEVQLTGTARPDSAVRFGNVVCGNGADAATENFAVIAHKKQADLNLTDNYALRQSPAGAVHLNAPTNQVVSIRQGGVTPRLAISKKGNVIVGDEVELAGAPAQAIFQVAGDVFKSTPGIWGASDARTKEDVHDLELGLAEVRQMRPVRYRYNGRAGTPRGRANVGVIGQEIEAVIPETVQRVSVAAEGIDDLRVFDPSALTFVLINAVKELAAKVEQLERALAATTAPTSDARPPVA